MATMDQETKQGGMAEGPSMGKDADRKRSLVGSPPGGGGGGDVKNPPDPKSGLGSQPQIQAWSAETLGAISTVEVKIIVSFAGPTPTSSGEADENEGVLSSR